MNISLSPILKKLSAALLRYKTLGLTLAVIALFGYTAYQISQITSIEPDQVYYDAQQTEATTPNLKANKATVEQLQQLRPAGDANLTVSPGASDPFSMD